MQRRTFMQLLLAAAVAAVPGQGQGQSTAPRSGLRYLRPPGALAEVDFLARCIRCGQCGEACPNRCISYFGLENGTESLDTPYIIPREQGCILCMKCGVACPTGAIERVARDAETIMARVKMGTARVDHSLCLSYQGKSCGVCYRACPLPDIAISVGYLEQPQVLDGCIGCGLCERSCIQIPQAIRIFPNREGVA